VKKNSPQEATCELKAILYEIKHDQVATHRGMIIRHVRIPYGHLKKPPPPSIINHNEKIKLSYFLINPFFNSSSAYAQKTPVSRDFRSSFHGTYAVNLHHSNVKGSWKLAYSTIISGSGEIWSGKGQSDGWVTVHSSRRGESQKISSPFFAWV